MDGGAWWATVHRVAKSRTRLSDFTFTFLIAGRLSSEPITQRYLTQFLLFKNSNLHILLVEVEDGTAPLENCLAVSWKVKHRVSYDPKVPLQGF